MLVETTHYYARAGESARVLAQRRAASAIRARLGLRPGTILTKVDGAGPDVCWSCSYADMDDYQRDMAVRAASAEFAQARSDMRKLVERFERHLNVEVPLEPAPADPQSPRT